MIIFKSNECEETWFSPVRYREKDILGIYYRYYSNSKLHRKNGPATVERIKNSGDYYWFHKGITYRTNGPATILFGTKYWVYKDMYYIHEETFWNK